MQRSLLAAYREQALGTLVNLVDGRIEDRADVLLVVRFKDFGDGDQALRLAV